MFVPYSGIWNIAAFAPQGKTHRRAAMPRLNRPGTRCRSGVSEAQGGRSCREGFGFGERRHVQLAGDQLGQQQVAGGAEVEVLPREQHHQLM